MELEYGLQAFGLSDKESKVFLELLPLGSVTLQEVANRTPFPRSTTYHTLNYLVQKGLVAKIIKKKITYYTASSPAVFKEQLEEKQRLAAALLPQLESLQKHLKRPSRVEIYEGFSGVHTILADLVKEAQQVHYFGGYKKSLRVLKHLPNYVRRVRIEKGIKAKMIYDFTDESTLHLKEYQAVSELRFLDYFENFPVMIFIYGDKVSMFTHKTDLVGVIIQNQDFADAMLMVFSTYWEMAVPAEEAFKRRRSSPEAEPRVV